MQNERESLGTLIAIFTAAWALVLLGTVIIFEVIVPLNIFHSFLDSILKGVLGLFLVVAWLFLFVEMRDHMVKTQLRLEKKISN